MSQAVGDHLLPIQVEMSHGDGSLPTWTTNLNPYMNKAARDGTSFVKILRWILVIPTLLPLRIILLLGSVLVGYILARIATCGLGKDDFDSMTGKPLAAWRRCLLIPITTIAPRWTMLILGFWWVPVKGRCASHAEAPIIVSNHVSGLVDGMFLLKHAKLAEQSYSGLPVLSAFMIATQSIFVDRSRPESRQKAKDALLRRCVEQGWPQTVVFPEGTCTNGTAVVQFKAGAFSPGKAVQPVALRYSRSPLGGFDPSFTTPLNMGTYLLGMLMQVANFVEVEYLPVVVPTEEEQKDDIAFATRVQKVIAQALNVPATKHAAEDLVLATAAMNMGMPFEAGCVMWAKVTENLSGMRVKNALKVLEQFKSLDRDGSGEVDFEEFTTVMQNMAADGARGGSAPTAQELQKIFSILDRNDDGRVNFQEYLSSAAVLNGMHKEDRLAGWSLAFDLHAQGVTEFSREQVREFTGKVFPHVSMDFETLFAKLDRDENGRVSKEEFLAFVEEHQIDLNLRPTLLMHNLPISVSFVDAKKKDTE